MAESKQGSDKNLTTDEEQRQFRLVITAKISDDQEEEQVRKWLEDFVDEIKGSFPLKDKPEAVTERMFSKIKNHWEEDEQNPRK